MFLSFDKLLICFYFLAGLLNCFCFSIEELKAINYEVDIVQSPIKKGEEQTLPMVHVTSIFGQEYQCLLPHVEEEEVAEKVAYTEKSTDIKELLKPMHTGNCLLKAKDWWTYELCFGQYIKQFHIEDGQIIGQVLTLGLYDSDYDWNNDTNQEKFKHTKQRFHSQYYINGTKCDLTGQPRVAEVRIFCEEDAGDYIHRVDEPGTCSYVIAVHTSRVCAHPQLKPLPSKKIHTIPCHPLLTDEQYTHYLEKLEEESTVMNFKRSQWFNTQQERLQEMKTENAEESENEEYVNIIEDKASDFNLNDLSVSKIESNKEQSATSAVESKSKNIEEPEVTEEFEEYDKDFENFKTFISPAKLALVKSIEEIYESINNEEIENDDNAYDKYASKLTKLIQKLNKAEKEVAEGTKSPNKAEPMITKESVTDKSEDKQSNTEIKKDDIKTENKKENEIKADKLPNEDNSDDDDDDLQVRIRRLERTHSNGNAYEIDRVQQKKLEKAIKEKLEKYGVNTGGRRIEVKIIKAGYYDSHLTDEEASQFENMITALLTGEQEAIQEMERNKKLEENYKFTWDDEEEEDI